MPANENENRPLAGKSIAITRPEGQADAVMERLQSLGAHPIATPTIAIVPPEDFTQLDAAIVQLPSYNWLLFTSVNGVEIFFARLSALGIGSDMLQHLNIGAIGPATAQALAAHGVAATFMPTAYVAESILAEIGDVAGQRMLLPRAELARPLLAAGLRERGAQVDEIAAYRTVPGRGIAPLAALLRNGQVDAVTFTSSSTVRFLCEGLIESGMRPSDIPALLARTAVVCIGPVTAKTASEAGIQVAIVAESYTMDGLVAALVDHFKRIATVGSQAR
jgi:uroporphyrinogen III methyltransferase/synthase